MPNPIVVDCPKDEWTLVAEAIQNAEIHIKKTDPYKYWVYKVFTGGDAPTDLSLATLIQFYDRPVKVSTSSSADVYVYPEKIDGQVIVDFTADPTGKSIFIQDKTTGKYASVESNGALAVNIQDQHSRMLDLKFIQAQGAPTTLTVEAVQEDRTITLASTAGFADKNVVGLFCPCGDFYFGQQVGDPVGNVITLDTPIDLTYIVGSSVITAIKNMAVDGSSITQVFQIGPVGGSSEVEIDVTRVAGYLQDNVVMDDAKFGGITALIYGIVLRKNNGTIENKWNMKTNGELAELCAGDFDYTSKAPAGSYGARFRNSFSGQEKHGVTVRLEPGDILEMLIQDDLTDLQLFTMTAQGHIVTD